MHRPAMVLVFAAFSGLLNAQAADSLEIRGTVVEFGSDGIATLPVAAAEVSLIEFVHDGPNVNRSPYATAYTDPRGAYVFHPEHTGDYYVEVKKEGYRYASNMVYGTSVKLDQTHSTAQSTFTLRRPGGSITGRVVDEDGQPVSGISVAVQGAGLAQPRINFGGDATAVTAADGTFTATDVLPGPQVVRISSRAPARESVVPHFSADDRETVDHALETTYWPGGAAQPTASIPVSPGSSANVGTIKIRNGPLYRAHISVPHVECEAGEKWTFSAAYSGEITLLRPDAIPCANDFLVRNLRPGTYTFRLQKDAPAPAKWALASVNISSKNIEVSLTLEPEAQIAGRVVAADGATLPPLDKIKVAARGGGPAAAPDAQGKFVFTNLNFPEHQIDVVGLTKDYYVKEFHLNGASSPDAVLMLNPGANQVEVVIDDKPGTISGTVMDGDKPAAEAEVNLYPKVLPPMGLPMEVSRSRIRTDKDGRFQINGVAPGEYRIVAWQAPPVTRPSGYGDILPKLAAAAQPITVERGRTTNADLKLTDPSR